MSHVGLVCRNSLEKFTGEAGRVFEAWLWDHAFDCLLDELYVQLVDPSEDVAAPRYDLLWDAFEMESQRLQHSIGRMIAKKFPQTHIPTEDLVAEAVAHCLRQIRQGSRPPSGAPFTRWILAMSHNRIVDLLRRKVLPSESLETQFAVVADEAPPEAQVMREYEQTAVQKMLETLTDQERVILRLKYLLGKSSREIADIMDLPLTTIDPMLHRARQHGRKSFTSLYPELAADYQELPGSGRGRPAKKSQTLSKPSST